MTSRVPLPVPKGTWRLPETFTSLSSAVCELDAFISEERHTDEFPWSVMEHSTALSSLERLLTRAAKEEIENWPAVTASSADERLDLYIRKHSKKKEANEKLKDALTALEELNEAIEELAKSGITFRELIEDPNTTMSAMVADKIYMEEIHWMTSITNLILSLRKLVRQAEGVTHFETFMSDLKRLDKPVYEMIRMLSRSYKDGKIDPSEFPMFISLYGPKTLHESMDKAVKEELVPLEGKIEDMADSLPTPHRTRIIPLRHALEKMNDANQFIVPVNEETTERMLDQSPEWLQMMTRILERAMKKSQEIAKRKAAISSAPRIQPKARQGPIWPTPKKRRSR